MVVVFRNPFAGADWLAAASVGNKVLFGGGFSAGGVPSNIVDICDTSSFPFTWSSGTLSQVRGNVVAASVPTGSGDYKALFAGGYTGSAFSNVVDIYDASSGTWSSSSGSLSVGRQSLAAASAGNKVVFAGGENPGALSTVDIYDASSGTWSSSSGTPSCGSLSQARYLLAAASAGNEVLFAGGVNSSVVDIYDASSGTWSSSSGSLSVPRGVLAAGSVGSKILFAGGEGSGGAAYGTVNIYDTSTGSWSTTRPLSVARYRLAAASAGNKVFFAGGENAVGLIDAVNIYTLQHYATITSTQTFGLQDNTTVDDLMQLNGGSLSLTGSGTLGSFNLAVGSMGGTAPINLSGGTLTVGSDNTSTTYSGGLSGGGGLTKIGSGALTLFGAASYNGATTVSGGTLRMGLPNTLPVGGTVTVGGGATLDLNGYGFTTSYLGGTGTATLSGGTLTLNNPNGQSLTTTIAGSGGRPPEL